MEKTTGRRGLKLTRKRDVKSYRVKYENAGKKAKSKSKHEQGRTQQRKWT